LNYYDIIKQIYLTPKHITSQICSTGQYKSVTNFMFIKNYHMKISVEIKTGFEIHN